MPAEGELAVALDERCQIDVERMVGAFRRGLRDLGTIWEHVLAPETLGDVLSLEAGRPWELPLPGRAVGARRLRLRARPSLRVVYRDHLLRSLVPLYLGRTAAFVLATRRRDAAAGGATLERSRRRVRAAKPYLVDRWR